MACAGFHHVQIWTFAMVVSFTGFFLEKIDPLRELDVMGSYRMDNRHQCQRLCWYWKACGRYSFYSQNDHNSRDNCVLHGRRQEAETLAEGWTDEEALLQHMMMSPSEGCYERPCSREEMCVPAYTSIQFMCVDMRSDAWLSQSCTATCSTPVSAGKTACIQGQCLCAKGYLYSESQRACVAFASCTEFGNSFVRYEGYNYTAIGMQTVEKVTDIAQCKQQCATVNCFMFVHAKLSRTCFLIATGMSRTFYGPSDTSDIYRRTCV